MSKPRLVKDFDKISDEILSQIKVAYPYGFQKKLIQFKNSKGKLVSALPFETDEFHFLIRMSRKEAQEIIQEDDDYGEDGQLTEDAREKLEDELSQIENINDED